ELFGTDPVRQALAVGAIADLVVVLHVGNESIRRQSARRLAPCRAVTLTLSFAVMDEAIGKAFLQVGYRVARAIRITVLALAGGEIMQHVVDIVIPLGGEILGLVLLAVEPGGDIV